jgi:hypothetical protein
MLNEFESRPTIFLGNQSVRCLAFICVQCLKHERLHSRQCDI